MKTDSAYDPPRHPSLWELSLANVALLNASIAFVGNANNRTLFKQLEIEVEQVVRLRKLAPPTTERTDQ